MVSADVCCCGDENDDHKDQGGTHHWYSVKYTGDHVQEPEQYYT